MACEWFECRWQRLLDERRDPALDDRLAEHARQCPDCGEWLESQSMLFGSIERWAEEARHRSRPVCRPSQTRDQGWPRVAVTAAVAVAAMLVLSLFAIPNSGETELPAKRSASNWKALVAEWSAASGRWLAANVAPVNAAPVNAAPMSAAPMSAGPMSAGPANATAGMRVDNSQPPRPSDVSPWEFHWVTRVGYSLASTDAAPVERMESFAGTIRPLATTVYRVVETLRPKWQTVAPPLTPDRQRPWNRLEAEPLETPAGRGERNSSWRPVRSGLA